MKLNIRRGKVKSRITLLVVLLVFGATGLVATVSLYLVEQQMRSIVGDQQYSLLSSAAAYIDADLESKGSLLKILGEEIAFNMSPNETAIQSYLESHGSLRNEFYNVVAFDNVGKLIGNLNDRRAIGSINVADRQYFRDTVAFKEGVISRPFKSNLSGKPVIVITEPIFDKAGRLLYILGGAIDLERPQFFGQLEALNPGKSGYLLMLTSTGDIIHHPNKKRILMNVNDEPGGPTPSTLAALNGFNGWMEGTSMLGVRSLIAYKHLYKTDWIIGAIYPVDEAFIPLISMRKNALIASLAVAAICGLLGWFAVLRLLSPLGALQKHVARLAQGDRNIDVFNVNRQDEFGELSRAFYNLSQKRETAENNLGLLARTDALTGLSNRRKFEETFDCALKRACRTNDMLALAYLDVDHFKAINDTYGHGIGDEVLKEFAKRLALSVRSTDTVARLGGDEFVVIFENVENHSVISTLGEKVIECMRSDFECSGTNLTLTTSVGIAVTSCGDQTTANEMLAMADRALYTAKQSGRNRCAVLDYAGAVVGSPILQNCKENQ